MRRKILSLTLATGSLFLSTTALAGVVFQVETTYHSGSSGPETMTAYADGCNIKMEIGAPGSDTGAAAGMHMDEMIYKCAGGGTMVVINHEEQYYYSPPDRSAGGNANPFGDILKDVPADQRGALEDLMKQMGKGGQSIPGMPQKSETRVVNTGKTVQKNGYKTTVIEIYEGERLNGKLYGTAMGNIDGGQSMMNSLIGYTEFLEKQIGGFGGDQDFGQEFEKLKDLGLFPVAGEDFDDDGSLDESWKLRSAKRRTLDPAAFEPPSGYKRRSMFPQ